MSRNRPLHRGAAAILGFSLLLASGMASAQDEIQVGLDSQRDLTLTVYNQNLALVSEQRRVDLAAGENHLALLGVSPQIQPATLILGGNGITLIEQAFEADVLSQYHLLDRALGKPVWVRRVNPADGSERYLDATLLSLTDPILVRIGERLETTPRDLLAFPAALGAGAGLRERPSLLAVLSSAEAGTKDLTVSYLTAGLNWQADYVGLLRAEEDRLALTALVTLSNDSGTAFSNGALRLVAGDVNRVPDALPPSPRRVMAEGMAMAADVAQAPVGDQHLYSLGRRISIADRASKQVQMLTAPAVPYRKEYRFEQLVNAYGGSDEIGPVNADVVVILKNDSDGGLGAPLPQGVVRLYQAGANGLADVFLGEDRIGHTPEKAEVRLRTGRAFDVTGEARLTDFERLSNKSHEAAQEIVVKNAKKGPVQVKVIGHLPPGWRMLEESLPHARETASRIAWTLEVPAEGETKLSFRLRVNQP